ncbi:secreted protein [Candidatus Omnitrophus magneticus]|uniref:Secreted protein n=1 Tax=Candidatus Omnitrophus magneticus TaxID=1609969 RepID=A0A0F0CRF3_9BACT|nr:secreted protein [Candidatus Omnitrophus magneticus]
MKKYAKNSQIKILSICLTIFLSANELLIADILPRAELTNLQPQTLITDGTAESIFISTTKYLWTCLEKIKETPENLNVPRIEQIVSSIFNTLKQSPNIPENIKKSYANFDIIPSQTDVIIKFNDFLVRYFNPTIPGSKKLNQPFDSIYTELLESQKGLYLSMQLFKQKNTLTQKINAPASVDTIKIPENTVKQAQTLSEKIKLYLSKKIYNSFIKWLKKSLTVHYDVKNIEKHLKKYGWKIPAESRSSTLKLWEKIYRLYPPSLYGTAQHALRGALFGITIYSSLTCDLKEKNFEELNNLITASLAHDLGKGFGEIRELTLKEGIFNQQEREKMKLHVEKSLEILEKSNIKINKKIEQAILTHHPFYKGNIPKEIIDQILYIVDQIDARQDVGRSYRKMRLRSWNPYRIQEAFEEAIEKKWISQMVYNTITNLVNSKNPEYMRLVLSTYYPCHRFILKNILRYRQVLKLSEYLPTLHKFYKYLPDILKKLKPAPTPNRTRGIETKTTKNFEDAISKNLKILHVDNLPLHQVDTIIEINNGKPPKGKKWNASFFSMIDESNDLHIALWNDENNSINAYMAFVTENKKADIKFLGIRKNKKNSKEYTAIAKNLFTYLNALNITTVNILVAFGDSEMQEWSEEIIKSGISKKFNKKFKAPETWIYTFTIDKKQVTPPSCSINPDIKRLDEVIHDANLNQKNDQPDLKSSQPKILWTADNIKNNISIAIPSLIETMITLSNKAINTDKSIKYELFIDEDIASGMGETIIKEIKKYLSALSNVKKNNTELSLFLKNLEIIQGRIEQFDSHKTNIPLENIIVITNNSRAGKIKNPEKFGLLTAVDAIEFKNRNYYFPLVEIILFAIANYLAYDKKALYEYYNNIPYVFAPENTNQTDFLNYLKQANNKLIIKLIPPAEEFKTEIFVDIINPIKDVLRKA